jgi:hypothetical protein
MGIYVSVYPRVHRRRQTVIGGGLEDESKLLDFFVAEIGETGEVVNCGTRRIPGSVN